MSLLMTGDFLSGCSNRRILSPFDPVLYSFWQMAGINRGVAIRRKENGLANNRVADNVES